MIAHFRLYLLPTATVVLLICGIGRDFSRAENGFFEFAGHCDRSKPTLTDLSGLHVIAAGGTDKEGWTLTLAKSIPLPSSKFCTFNEVIVAELSASALEGCKRLSGQLVPILEEKRQTTELLRNSGQCELSMNFVCTRSTSSTKYCKEEHRSRTGP